MQDAPTAGIDLSLKMLVWQDADNKVNLSYNDPSWVAARHGLGSSDDRQAVTAMAATLEALARHAVVS